MSAIGSLAPPRLRAAQGGPARAVWRQLALGLGLIAAGWLALQLGATPLRMLTLLVVAPVAEEALFRAGLHEALLRQGWAPAAANGLTALAFAIAHVLASGQATAVLVLLPGLWLGHVYQQRRRLRECIAWHAGLNAAWIVGCWLLP